MLEFVRIPGRYVSQKLGLSKEGGQVSTRLRPDLKSGGLHIRPCQNVAFQKGAQNGLGPHFPKSQGGNFLLDGRLQPAKERHGVLGDWLQGFLGFEKDLEMDPDGFGHGLVGILDVEAFTGPILLHELNAPRCGTDLDQGGHGGVLLGLGRAVPVLTTKTTVGSNSLKMSKVLFWYLLKPISYLNAI